MVKINTAIFLACLSFLLIFLWYIYNNLTRELAQLKNSVRLSETLLLPPNISHKESINESEKVFSAKQHKEENGIPNEEIINYLPCQSFGNMRWFHDTKNGQCYEVGQQGPCGESMTFYQHPQFSNFGFCDCDDVVEVKSIIFGCEEVERPLIYYTPDHRCYTVFSQGPCQPDEWLILDKSFRPICEKNACVAKQKDVNEFSLEFWIAHEKRCFKTMSRGYCEKGNVLKVTKNDWKPECQKNRFVKCPQYSSVSIPALKCRPGNRIHQLGMCNLLQ